MWDYTPPIRHMMFVIDTLIQAPVDWAKSGLESYQSLDADTTAEILHQAGQFASKELLPLNAVGDQEGCQFSQGIVTVPSGFKKAYHTFCAGGWPAISAAPQWGGQGLPSLLNVALYEMLAACNHAWLMYPGLTQGGYACLEKFATEDVQQQFLADIVSGKTLVTMCLSEPQAGSDVGSIRTKATQRPGEEMYTISGQKIFISGGDHNLTENIVHLVLARIDNAPTGSKGLSLFLVPKKRADGQSNAVHCIGIEQKMGIKGSATCVMQFDDAQGWLLGSENQGLQAMFVMMNEARIQVGMQGLGHLEIACQNAHQYAALRVQGKVVASARNSDTTQLSIDHHPAVHRILFSNQSLVEGQRFIAYWAAHLIDMEHSHATVNPWVGLLTPIIKAMFTKNGYVGSSELQQVWGGYGYLKEYGIEQTVRDSRIALIYEGTNEIQAIDFLMRKILSDQGRNFFSLLDHIHQDNQAHQDDKSVTEYVELVDTCIQRIKQLVPVLLKHQEHEPSAPYLIADDFLQMSGVLLLSWSWLKTVATLKNKEMDDWEQERVQVAMFGLQWHASSMLYLLDRMEKWITKPQIH